MSDIMFRRPAVLLELGTLFDELATDQSQWSQATFGSDADRGPVGALRHLEKEAREACEAAGVERQVEIADCFLLILDAARRAGMKPYDLLSVAAHKMQINKGRKWPVPVDDQPVEHVKT